jgi:cell wall-associated NlpC family hydrolase
MGLVFASRRTWIDPEHLYQILADDEYQQLGGVAEAQPGDVVVYRGSDGQPSHVGIIWERNLIVPGQQEDPVKVLSQWGADGEYLHDLSDVPLLLGTATEFWTDRRTA